MRVLYRTWNYGIGTWQEEEQWWMVVLTPRPLQPGVAGGEQRVGSCVYVSAHTLSCDIHATTFSANIQSMNAPAVRTKFLAPAAPFIRRCQ